MTDAPLVYTDEECYKMIKAGVAAFDAPKWVREEIEKKRQKIERDTLPPDEEIEKFMEESGGTAKVV